MAVADLVSAWLAPFVAPIILYLARQYAIRKQWLGPPSNPSDDIRGGTQDILLHVLETLRNIEGNMGGHRKECADKLKDIKGSLDRLKELGEARERVEC